MKISVDKKGQFELIQIQLRKNLLAVQVDLNF